ncbi:MAG: hypothetical protein ACUVR1_04480 [Fimbriimonadales bacterium]
MKTAILSLLLVLGVLTCAAQRVYLFGTGVPERDAALYEALQAHGLQVTQGVPYQAFDGSQSLSGYQVAVLVGTGYPDDMPIDGQWALLTWVGDGHGLVTLEWTVWSANAAKRLSILRALLPATYRRDTYRMRILYQQQVSDSILNQGLTANLDLGEGHEAHLRPKLGATVYYTSDYAASAGGVIGWAYQEGRVISLSVAPAYALNLTAQNAAFRRLLTNAVRWAALNACTPSSGDVDGNGCVDDADLLEVLFAFGATGGDADVNCDSVVDDADLLEVLFAFGSGC